VGDVWEVSPDATVNFDVANTDEQRDIIQWWATPFPPKSAFLLLAKSSREMRRQNGINTDRFTFFALELKSQMKYEIVFSRKDVTDKVIRRISSLPI